MRPVSVLAALALSALVGAQTQDLTVRRVDADAPAQVLSIAGADVPALEILTRASAAAGVALSVDPAAIPRLTNARLSVDRERVLLDELGLLVGVVAGVEVTVTGDVVSVAERVATPASAVDQALRQVEHALLGHADPDLMAALRYQRACLLLASGATDAATTAFSDLIADFPGHPLAVDARGLAISAALRAGLHDRALALLAAAESASEALPNALGAELLSARVHAAAGNHEEALLRARRVALVGATDRDRALAGLFVAELHYGAGDGRRMIESIDRLPRDFDRTCRDLASKESFARGLGKLLLGDPRAALLHLRVALRSVPPQSRPAVARAIADAFVAAREPVPAWIAMREALAVESRPAVRRAILVRCAEMEEALGLLAPAREACLSVLRDASGQFPEAERVLATLARCFIASEAIDDARVLLDALAGTAAWKGWAAYQLARLERRAGEPDRALRALARIDAASCRPPGPTADDVRTLRGQLLLEAGDPLQAAEVFRGDSGEPQR